MYFQYQEPWFSDFVIKTLMLACILTFENRFLRDLDDNRSHFTLPLDASVDEPDSFKVTVVWEIKNFCVHFLANVSTDLDEI